MHIGYGTVICIALSAFVAVCGAQDSGEREAQLKAAYLFNFVKFVEWPSTSKDLPLTVCFKGGDAVLDALNTGLEKKKVGARSLAIRRVDQTNNTTGCDVLYFEADPPPLDLKRMTGEGKRPILTIGEVRQFIQTGGMIGLFTENNRLRFSISIDNAQKAGLRISSSLLQLAASVEKGEGK